MSKTSKFRLNRSALHKPHIFARCSFGRLKWMCVDWQCRGVAAKPVTAYRAWKRSKDWNKAGCPGRPGMQR